MAVSKLDTNLLAELEELMAVGIGHDRMIAMFQERHGVKGHSARTLRRYMARIRTRWATEEIEKRPERRIELRAKLQATFEKAYFEGGPSLSVAVQCLRVMAKIDGLEAPERVEVSSQVNVKAMSPFERQRRIEELWAIRAKALGSPDARFSH